MSIDINFDELVDSLPLTPPRGEPMPQTQAYWEKRAAMDLELIMEQKNEISKLKRKVNKLEQKIG